MFDFHAMYSLMQHTALFILLCGLFAAKIVI